MRPANFAKLLKQIPDMMTDLFYYDRKEDDDFTVEDAEENLTEEQKDIFCAEIRKCLS